MPHHHPHEHACDCAAHRRREDPAPGAWGALLPVLACAVCPACLSTYAKLFSIAGVGFGLSELHHDILLAVAITTSVALSAWRSWRTRRAWPIGVALAGSTLVLCGHMFGEVAWLEWAGVLTLLVGGLTEHFRLRRLAAGARAAAHA
jgi:hypothetical protein